MAAALDRRHGRRSRGPSLGAIVDRHLRPGARSSTSRPRPGSCSSCSSSSCSCSSRASAARDDAGRRELPVRAARRAPCPNGCARSGGCGACRSSIAGFALLVAIVAAAARPTSRRGTRPGRSSSRFAICAVSVVVLTGWGGQLSLGQMAFAGLGALTAAALVARAVASTSAGTTPASSTAALPAHRVPVDAAARRGRRVPRRGARRRRRAPRARPAARDQHARVRDRGAGLPLRPPVLHRPGARPCRSRAPTSGRSSSRTRTAPTTTSCSFVLVVVLLARRPPPPHRDRPHDRRRARERARRRRR